MAAISALISVASPLPACTVGCGLSQLSSAAASGHICVHGLGLALWANWPPRRPGRPHATSPHGARAGWFGLIYGPDSDGGALLVRQCPHTTCSTTPPA